jgi:hypothetical protein
VISGSDSSSELQGEKKERTEEVFAEASSRKEMPMIGGLTARIGRGIARTCGCGGGGVELSFVGTDDVEEAGDIGLISAVVEKGTEGFESGDSLRELDIFVGLCEEEREGGGERGRDIACW